MVIKAQHESLIQQTNAALKVISSPQNKCTQQKDILEFAEDLNIEEKYNTLTLPVVKGSDLPVDPNGIQRNAVSQSQHFSNSQSILFKKKGNK